MLKILIVDDEKLVRDNLLQLIDWQEHGFKIVGQADSCKSAITLLNTLTPDIVVCDVEMPHADGITLVRLAREYGHDCRFVMLSAHDDFDYVRDSLTAGAADYILKHQITGDRLLQTLYKIAYNKNSDVEQKLNSNSQHTFMRDMLNGNIDICVETLQLLHNNGIFSCETSGVIVVKCTTAGNAIPKDMSGALKAFLPQISSQCKNSFFLKQGTLLLDVLPEDISEIISTLTTLAHQSQNLLFAVYSTTKSDSLRLVELVNKMHMRLECSFYYEISKAWQIDVDDEIFLPLNSGDSAESYIETFALQDVEIFLANLLFPKNGYYEPYAIKKLSIDFCNRLLRNLQLHSYNSDELIREKFSWIKQIDESQSNLLLAYLLSTLFSRIQHVIDLHSEPALSPLVSEVTKYLKDNMGYGVTLQSVSEKFFVNKSYLSTIFRTQTGKTFTRYLMDLRMDQAKKLLLDPDRSVSDVANATGFIETSYFSTTFKKEVGLTPLLYKQRMGK